MKDSGSGKQNKRINPYNFSKDEIINKAFKFHLKGNISRAEEFYQIFLNRGFSDARVNSNLGQIYRDKGNLKNAELLTRQAIKLVPNYADAHANLGLIMSDIGRLKEAEISTRKAIQLNPDFANAHSTLGAILIKLDKLKEAEFSFRKAIQLNPDFVIAHLNLGTVLRDLGKFQEAEISTRKAIELNPNYADAHANLGLIMSDIGRLKEAEISIRKAIKLNPGFANAHFNLGIILTSFGRLQEAESFTRKSIQLDPDFAVAHFNLGTILRNLGKLQEAEFSYLTAIQLNSDYSKAFFALSNLKLSNKYKIFRDKLFSKNLSNYKLEKDKVNICFSRANILHRESNFRESSKYLLLANNLKQKLNPSNVEYLLNKSKKILFESNKEEVKDQELKNYPKCIFILGMPRSGSTLVESILSMNDNVDDLGERNILEKSFIQWKNHEQNSTLAKLYLNQINLCCSELRTTTNKWLYNYQYTGIISTQIPNSKIIHCFRNPLDNILSIYRSNFAKGNEYSSSLIDCAKVYLDQEEVMTQYKKRFRSKIYDLNYDLLVRNSSLEIKSLISWLGWNWDNKYLSPDLNPRSVFTASSVQVRSPINSKSIGGWKNYKEMLKPAMEIITQKNKYKNLKY